MCVELLRLSNYEIRCRCSSSAAASLLAKDANARESLKDGQEEAEEEGAKLNYQRGARSEHRLQIAESQIEPPEREFGAATLWKTNTEQWTRQLIRRPRWPLVRRLAQSN